ncbi:MAG: 30S ribosomal protein S20 [Puniceicoccales bacterium]|jgi:small subunit ribosomal protein S20|nr:30S ribosomal protein S20 [Puniceicoccales bacterium]
MANKRASRKSVLQTQRRTASNGVVRGRLRTLEKKLRAAVTSRSGGVRLILSDCLSALDKAAKRNVIHRNSADRRKSIFVKLVFP